MRSLEYTDDNGVEIGVETYCAGYVDDGFSVYFKDKGGEWVEVFSNPCYISADCEPSDDMLKDWADDIVADSPVYQVDLAAIRWNG